VTVADAPGAVIDVPQNVSLNRNAAGFTAIVTRLDASPDPLELSLEAAADGLKMEPLTVPKGSTRADVKLQSAAKAPGEFVLVARCNGAVIGKSHPVRVRSSQ
jgi:hypothetical protein